MEVERVEPAPRQPGQIAPPEGVILPEQLAVRAEPERRAVDAQGQERAADRRPHGRQQTPAAALRCLLADFDQAVHRADGVAAGHSQRRAAPLEGERLGASRPARRHRDRNPAAAPTGVVTGLRQRLRHLRRAEPHRGRRSMREK